MNCLRRCLFAFFLEFILLPLCFRSAHSQIVQSGNGPCPINIANVSGTVHIESSGCFDERILRPLLEKINRQDRDFRDKAHEVDGWIKRYYELQERLGVPGAFSKLREEARAKFKSNDLEGATATKQKIIEQEEDVIDQVAADYYDLAELYVLQLKPLEAQQFYAKSFRYRPENSLYAEAYARNLCDTNQTARAVEVYQMSIKELRELSQSDPAKYSPNLACTLADLTGLLNSIGDFKGAYAASTEGLRVAKTILPQDSSKAQEHVADALVGLGLAQTKIGETKNAKQNLLAAEKIYSDIGVTNFNRPAISDALADLAMQEKDGEEEKRERERTFELERELFPQNPRMRRNRLADSTYQLFEYYARLGNVKNAGETVSTLVKLADGIVDSDPSTSQFLQATAALLRAKTLYQSGESESTLKESKRCLDSLKQIESQLRPRELNWISLAYTVEGWSLLQQGSYRAALDDFESAAQERFPLDPLRRQRVTRDKRLAQFFALDFSTAAREFLLHAEDMQETDGVLWNYFIEKRNDPGYEIKIAGPQSSEPFDRLIIGVNSGALPKSTLNAASKLAEEKSDTEGKCKRHFFVGESWLLFGNKKEGLSELKLCGARESDSFYAGVMKSEGLKWTQ